MLDSNKLQEYFDFYNNYTKTHKLGNKYLESSKIVMQTEHYRVYSSTNVIPWSSHGIQKNIKKD
ncbi:MAG: poly-beta-hydroxybutyrate polymerase [Rickettsia endosymbiont of Ixodes persulcatus]|nr:poly-beta-hydroxybutyrate polymerase [Rickettsia endosymbiont of Ixodes persulcatus]MCZ6903233.1 poly-beta-hydroxybutyrate polymerase [Rickettsia endosymbiont of Ixodes persulcatus]MCZ6908750.1 poly-beta-hydroxybutyrate polymerase [Rickettsia endosymbiont of Ixodes persulcatus]MCZ6909762.1 poly-beta-hydroxybutyrate polymerase [Rickettsia endosymbiont of Ixodes persulcatus]MCZ6914661.1 poly-beta-hydroxybutyrate polymerase [Rickettsia endosymbiont of Ixodes persulcatus]